MAAGSYMKSRLEEPRTEHQNMTTQARRGSKSSHLVRLSEGLEKSLSSYVCAAAAAGVSLLATNKALEAEVVYTPANTPIPVNGGFVPLDLNHDGIADFALWNLRFATSSGDRSSRRSILNLYAGCAPVGSTCQSAKNEIWGKGGVHQRFASALPFGARVAPSTGYFQQGPKLKNGWVTSPVALMGRFGVFYSYQGSLDGSYTSGQWMYTKDRYLGLQFVISGQLHYGWARVAVTLNRSVKDYEIAATLTGYAYETIPNKPIIAGAIEAPAASRVEPPAPEVRDYARGSLGQLALGASPSESRK